MLGAWLGCSADVFLCHDDEGCEQGGRQGVCQATGFCSFPDDGCDSGQRYGELAGGSLAGQCVEPEADTDPADTDPADTDPAEGSGSLDDGTGPATATSGPVDGTTGSIDDDCWVDDFDDAQLDPLWCPEEAPGIAIREEDGLLWLDLWPEQWEGTGHQGEVRSCEPRELLGISVTVEVHHVPESSSFTEGYLEVGSKDVRLGLGVTEGDLFAFAYEDGAYDAVGWVPYDASLHRWWRVRGTNEGLVAELSADGRAWEVLEGVYVDLAAEVGTFALGVWSPMVPEVEDYAAFERLEVCTMLE